MLHEMVQSAVSRASREAQHLERSDAFLRLQMQLQISGGLLSYYTPDGIYAMMIPLFNLHAMHHMGHPDTLHMRAGSYE